ncbi:peroxynitrite isomerase THAP4 [Papilio machaon]|uniref:peroxynitrite isomerase THAP4 n=1 Tax=Papilio machaon TaxID=76193 RepID=UPI001E663962|nr:peroxynitrite isomerase THAP4 [Papilio machaon]
MEADYIHEALKPISWLAGRWYTANGRGSYPSVREFGYHEELEFICLGQPMFNFLSISHHPEKGTAMHQERGFLRILPEKEKVALVVSHNIGLTTIEEGHYDCNLKEIKLASVSIARTSFSKPPHVTNLLREFILLSPDTLQVTVFMTTDQKPLSQHLKAVYKKVE